MEIVRLYEILDTLSKNEKLAVSKEEYAQLIDLLAEDDSPLILSWIQTRRRASELFDVPSKEILNEVLENLKLVIDNGNKADDSKISNLPNQKMPGKKIQGISLFIKRFQQVAAILVLPLLAVSIYLLIFSKEPVKESVANNIVHLKPFNTTTMQEYYSPAGTRSKVVLKDSTIVFLNSASTLMVDNSFGDSLRRVKLVGEGYFNVKKDKDRPFIVDAGDKLKIKVTGTTFTVNAYPDRAKIETVLLSGSIELVTGTRMVKLEPLQRAEFDNDRKIVIASGVKTEKYEKWKDGELVFDNTSMGEIETILEKWYNVEITIKDKEVMNYTFSGKLNNCSLQQVLEYITFSSQMKFTINKDKIDIYKVEKIQ